MDQLLHYKSLLKALDEVANRVDYELDDGSMRTPERIDSLLDKKLQIQSLRLDALLQMNMKIVVELKKKDMKCQKK